MPRHALRFGPYSPPDCEIGADVWCEARGAVRVHSWVMAGRIAWPLGQPMGRLGIARTTEGTRRLLAETARTDMGRHAKEGNRAMNADPEAKARRAATHAETLRRKPGWAEHMRELSRRAKESRQ